MKDFWFELGKIGFYWMYGAAYIVALMFGSWMWRTIFDQPITLTGLLISAAIVFVPIVVGKVMTSSDE